MKISQIYLKYKIPPNLQRHMLRVAALAKIISDNFVQISYINQELIIASCLLHDLGNIIKFDFENFPELLGDEQINIRHWKEVQSYIIENYGNQEDNATVSMLKELKVSDEIIHIIENWGFKNFGRIAKSDDWNWKIAVYADHRISPDGLVSLDENLKNKQKRYSKNRPFSSHLSANANELYESALDVEKQIAEKTKINLQQITPQEVDNIMSSLLEIEV